VRSSLPTIHRHHRWNGSPSAPLLCACPLREAPPLIAYAAPDLTRPRTFTFANTDAYRWKTQAIDKRERNGTISGGRLTKHAVRHLPWRAWRAVHRRRASLGPRRCWSSSSKRLIFRGQKSSGKCSRMVRIRCRWDKAVQRICRVRGDDNVCVH